MSDGSQLWMIKEASGKIIGPYTTEKVLELIKSMSLTGDELISLYPSGQWIVISKREEFYDILLEALSQTSLEKSQPAKAEKTPKPEEPQKTADSLKIEDSPKFEANLEIEVEPEEDSKPEPSLRSESSVSSEKQKATKRPDVIELTNVKAHLKKAKKKRAINPLIVTVIVAILGLYLILQPKGKSDKLRLLLPKKGRSAITAQEGKKRFENAVTDFSMDTVDSYRKAMNNLVQVIEGMPGGAGAYQMLCLTYRELWPFAYQDAADNAVVDEITKMAQTADPGGKYSGTCTAVRSLLQGRSSEAKAKVESLIESGATDAVLFELKGSILGGPVDAVVQGDFNDGLIYMDKSIQYWGQWLKPQVVSAVYLWRQGDSGQALTRLKRVLEVNRNHDVARAIYGIINYRVFSKSDVAISQLLAISESEKIPRILLSDLNLVLAEIYAARGEAKNAIRFAKASYRLNKSNRAAMDLMIKLGAKDDIDKNSQNATTLYVGDQFFASGNYLAAQAEYKAAYESNPKNSIAALKAAKALWKLGQTQDAFDWLDKAIKANPKLIEPYVTKAEYYTERHDYFAAATMLNKAQAVDKNSYEIFRGFAQVELKRGNAQGAITYCQTSLKINPSDVGCHVVIAKAYLLQQNVTEAYKFAGKAIELENSTYETQDVYSRALVKTQGFEAGLQYVRNLIEAYPRFLAYRRIYADLLYEEERFTDAEAVYRQLAQVDPTMKEAFWGWGKSLQGQGKFKEAIDPILRAGALDPGDAKSWFILAELYAVAGLNQKAIQAYETVINRNPLYPLAHLMLGRVAMQSGNLDLALKEAIKEQSNNPLGPDAFLLAAEVYSLQQRYTQCTGEIQKALKLGTLGARIYIIMARCYRLSGSIDTALSMIRIAEERESGLPDVYLELGLVYEAKGDAVSATEAYNQYLVLAPNGKDAETVKQKLNTLGR